MLRPYHKAEYTDKQTDRRWDIKLKGQIVEFGATQKGH